MDFRLNEDQIALRDGVRAFCEDRVPVERLPAFEESAGFSRELWGELAELGVFGLRLAEADGGAGLGWADAALVFAELGRRVIPGPLVWTHLAASRLPGAGSGKLVVGGLDLCGPAAGPCLVEHLVSIDVLLVLRPEGVFRLDPRELAAEPVGVPLDPLTPLHLVDNLALGERIGGPEDAAQLRLEGAVLASGSLLGIAESTLEMAVEYAGRREQFGRQIGSFQAIKHMLADTFVRQEVARAAVYAAGATLDEPEVGDPVRAVATAKLMAGEAALKNARVCIQVYGGMGYTWEVPVHFFLKRARVLESVFGTAEESADRIAAIAAAEA